MEMVTLPKWNGTIPKWHKKGEDIILPVIVNT
jgi:hypothetical protein